MPVMSCPACLTADAESYIIYLSSSDLLSYQKGLVFVKLITTMIYGICIYPLYAYRIYPWDMHHNKVSLFSLILYAQNFLAVPSRKKRSRVCQASYKPYFWLGNALGIFLVHQPMLSQRSMLYILLNSWHMLMMNVKSCLPLFK